MDVWIEQLTIETFDKILPIWQAPQYIEFLKTHGYVEAFIGRRKADYFWIF